MCIRDSCNRSTRHCPSSIRPVRVLLSRGTIAPEFKSEGGAAPCGSLGYRSPKRCRVRFYGVTACEPIGQGARECRPGPYISIHVCCTSSCCPRFTQGL